MTRRPKPTRYRLSAHPAIVGDLASLAMFGPAAVAAARTVLDDLAYGRVTGKRLGERNVTGDLSGLASVKFDVPDSPIRRFRLIYRDLDANSKGVVAIGVREEHAIYRLALARTEASSGSPKLEDPPREVPR